MKKGSGANKKGGKSVQNKGRKAKFGTVAKVALDNLRKTGGFSVHPMTSGSPTTGFMVSVKPEAEVIYDSVSQVNEAAFRDFYRANEAAFKENPNLHFGGWVDTNTGKVYFDLSARYDNVREAIDAAKATKQLAIWHLDAGKEIRQEDYDRRRRQGRATKTARAVRLPTRGGRRGRRAGLQGDGGGVPRVRQEGNGRQAGQPAAGRRGQVVLLPGSGRRAFCPGVSPPDNSCSPANKGTGKEPAPEPPEPAYDDTVITGRDDPRGALTGHNREQRMEYEKQASRWLADRGVELRVKDDIDGPPSIGAMQAAMKGVEMLEQAGVEVPREIFVENTVGNAPAAFDFGSSEILIDPDFDAVRLSEAIEAGWLAGTPENAAAASLVHEVAHRDHADRIRDAMATGRPGSPFSPEEAEAAKVSKMRRLIGSPDILGPTSDPWNRYERFGSSRVSESDARRIAGRVSRYATTTPLEFVAEVRAGATMGITYPKEVMDLYDDYLGPPLPSPVAIKEAA